MLLLHGSGIYYHHQYDYHHLSIAQCSAAWADDQRGVPDTSVSLRSHLLSYRLQIHCKFWLNVRRSAAREIWSQQQIVKNFIKQWRGWLMRNQFWLFLLMGTSWIIFGFVGGNLGLGLTAAWEFIFLCWRIFKYLISKIKLVHMWERVGCLKTF